MTTVNGEGGGGVVTPRATITRQISDRIAGFRFESYNPEKDVWKYYIQRFNLEMSLIQLNTEEYSPYRRDLLLRAIGNPMYQIAAEHFDPQPVTEVPYDELTSFLEQHNTKSVSYIIARVQFGQCYRETTMSISDYVAKLRSLAPPCVFGSTLDERLRDQFLIGLKNPTMIERLSEIYSSPNDKLDDIVKSALTIEAAQQQRAALTVIDSSSTKTTADNQLLQLQANNSNNSKKNKRNNSNANRNNNNNTNNNNRSNVNNRSSNRNSSSTADKDNRSNKGNQVLTLNPLQDCLRCGGKRHDDVNSCRAINATCRACSKVGHYDRACVSAGRATILKKAKVQRITSTFNNYSTYDDDEYRHLYNVISDDPQGHYIISPKVNGNILEMEYDTAADVSVISSRIWNQLGSPQLRPAAGISGYGDAAIQALGEFDVIVQLDNIKRELPLVVSQNDTASSLFGKNWMFALQVTPLAPRTSSFLNYVPKHGIYEVKNVASDDPDVKAILNEFSELFNRERGTVKDFQATFELTPDAQPKIFKPRPVPIALKRSVDKELDRLLKADILEPVNVMETPIEWASPIVLRIKGNGEVRFCADFKCTINKYVKKQLHPLKTINDIFPLFAGFIEYTTFDLKDAYYQVLVHPDCRKFLVIVTEKGYFRYKYLPFGLTISPMVFQKLMDDILINIDGAVACQDDVGTGGKNRREHLNRLRLVLKRFQDIGLALQPTKINILRKEIVFLGYIIDARGMRPVPTKVNAIKLMPAPTNISELRSFLGSINQFNAFVPNLLPNCNNLHCLLEKNVPWKWTKTENDTFEHLKTLITSDRILVHFDPSVPVTLACDACEYGIGAVLFHNYPDGRTRLISTASRTLTPAEKNYSVIDREALAIIFGIDKFYKYLYGRHFTLQCDHQPLERLFGEKSELPKLAASRLVRWAIQLSAFDYTFKYVPGKKNCLADTLSRLPVPGINPTSFESEASLVINQIVSETIENLALTSQLIRSRTSSDPILQQIVRFIAQHWPLKKDVSDEIMPFFNRRDLLSYEQGIIMLGSRVVIPASLQKPVLEKLHYTHPGINAVKSLARTTVWWPNCDNDIEIFIKRCEHCQRAGPREPSTPLNLWNTPEKSMERIHIDFTGPYHGFIWFVIIDAFSRWMEIFVLKTATTETAIGKLRPFFAMFGLPAQIVADNGAQFRSNEFKQFCLSNSIKLIFTTPYHSRSNGLVERAIRTFKWRYDKMSSDPRYKGSPSDRLQELLFVYRTTEHNTTGRTPAEMFLGRKLNTVLDLLRPCVRKDINQRQFRTKDNRDQSFKDREFEVNDTVYVRRPIDANWTPATIAKRSTPLSYTLDDGRRVHADHLKTRFTTPAQSSPNSTDIRTEDSVIEESPIPSNLTNESVTQTPTIRRNPQRTTRRPPRHFQDFEIN
ncbi:uncharacterized protein K02A2.6-like [Planococcus citri]|uniref:uncharacterized protein K02A2.6-like n=1 Tax=Planococcus citri TaxID=170843 RepID=UPI0031F8C489